MNPTEYCSVHGEVPAARNHMDEIRKEVLKDRNAKIAELKEQLRLARMEIQANQSAGASDGVYTLSTRVEALRHEIDRLKFNLKTALEREEEMRNALAREQIRSHAYQEAATKYAIIKSAAEAKEYDAAAASEPVEPATDRDEVERLRRLVKEQDELIATQAAEIASRDAELSAQADEIASLMAALSGQ